MSLTFTKRTIFSGIIAASSMSTLALAETTEGFTVTPSIGYYHFDNNRNTNNDTAYSLGLGYQFNNPWAVELTYLNADSKKNGQKVGVNEYRIDGLYSLPEFKNSNLTPYLAAGVGTADFSKASDSNNMFVNAGGGVKYAINNALAVRADFRLVNDVKDNHLDNITTVGVQYTFGHTAKTSDDYSTSATYSQPQAEETSTSPEPAAMNSTEKKAPSDETAMQGAEEKNMPTDEQQGMTVDKTATTTAAPMDESKTATTSAAPMDESKTATTSAAPMNESQAVAPAVVTPVDLTIQFAKNSSKVEQSFYPELQKLSSYLTAHPEATVTIEGYTDNSGAADYNQKLSEKRAKSIADVLVNTFNVSKGRVSSVGYGEEKPLMANDTPEHRMANRRVVAVISNSEA